MGLSTAQFWDMTPLEFARRQDVHARRHDTSAVFFRELYALLVNIHRDPKTDMVTGAKIYPLPFDAPEYTGPVKPALRVSKKKYAELLKRFT